MMFAPGVPNILASMRGLAYFEITARSAPTDLHSGQYGGVVPNAAAGWRERCPVWWTPTAEWRFGFLRRRPGTIADAAPGDRCGCRSTSGASPRRSVSAP